MRTCIVAFFVLTALAGCEGTLGLQAPLEGEPGGGGGPILLRADAGPPTDASARVDASWRAPDAATSSTPDAYTRPSCTPMCAGRMCGNDGCGGSCGSCASDTTCSASHQCVPTAPPVGEIVLFGTTSCGYCRAARTYFDAHDIAFRDVNLAAPGAFEEALNTADMYGRPGWSGGGMPFIRWPGAAVPANFTNGWSTALAHAHGL